MVEHLRGMDIPTLVLVVADTEEGLSNPDPGPMADEPHNFHLLSLDDIQQGLLNL